MLERVFGFNYLNFNNVADARFRAQMLTQPPAFWHLFLFGMVTESARAGSYYSSKQVQLQQL